MDPDRLHIPGVSTDICTYCIVSYVSYTLYVQHMHLPYLSIIAGSSFKRSGVDALRRLLDPRMRRTVSSSRRREYDGLYSDTSVSYERYQPGMYERPTPLRTSSSAYGLPSKIPAYGEELAKKTAASYHPGIRHVRSIYIKVRVR